MAWPKAEQLKAEREWFQRTAHRVAAECGGSVISARRTKKRNTAVGGHPHSLHMQGLAEDQVYDTAVQFGRAWEIGKKLGLHGYKKPASLGIHWQARPSSRKKAAQGRTT
jgi:hypothetical protein